MSMLSCLSCYNLGASNGEIADRFNKMLQDGTKPDRQFILGLIRACSERNSVELVRHCICKTEYRYDAFIATALLNVYGKHGSLKDAQQMFSRIQQPNIVTWNVMITICTRHGKPTEALQFFWRMQLDGYSPTAVTFVCVITACTAVMALSLGKVMHALTVAAGFNQDVVVAGALIHMYSKCSCIENAREVFEELQERDVTSWNTMIAANAQHGHFRLALALYQQMWRTKDVQPDDVTFVNILEACVQPDFLPEGELIHAHIVKMNADRNIVVGTALLSMYRRCGCLKRSFDVFDCMEKTCVITWNAMIAAFTEYGCFEQSLNLFRQMLLDGIKPSKFTFLTILSACASATAASEGKLIHSLIIESNLESNELVSNALVNMYGKVGNLGKVKAALNVKMAGTKINSWNAILVIYAQHEHARALELFKEMQLEGVTPDHFTFTAVLSASSHGGFVEDGCRLFYAMHWDYEGIVSTVKHYGCVIDMLGRAGWLNEAEMFIAQMPVAVDATCWTSLQASSELHGDDRRAARAARHARELEAS